MWSLNACDKQYVQSGLKYEGNLVFIWTPYDADPMDAVWTSASAIFR